MASLKELVPDRVPEHVPSDLVWKFDLHEDPAILRDPHEAFETLTRGAPDIFWSPHYGGFWVVRRIEDVRDVLRDWETFTNFPIGIPLIQGRPRPLIPEEIDPPEHTRYRNAMAPMFAPAAVKRREGQVRALTVALIEAFLARGACDFHAEFGHRLPVQVFLQLTGLPLEDTQKMLDWEYQLFRAPSLELRGQAGLQIGQYIGALLPGKMQAPGDDFIGHLVRWRDEAGRGFTPEELFDMTFMLFVAGLDTVPNALGMSWKYLAQHPARQQEIRDNPALIPDAIEELLRTTAVVQTSRRVRNDCTFRGVRMGKGDAILVAQTLANRDTTEFPDGAAVRFDRKVNNHLTFGLGPHRCIGSHLARLELTVALQEWIRRVPPFQVTPGRSLQTYGGHSLGVAHLPLSWSTP